MNILYCYLGLKEPLYEWRIMCIRRTFELYPDATYHCITNFRQFFGMRRVNPERIAQETGYKHGMQKHASFSDYARLWYLSKHPNTLYLDIDTWCEKPMPITDKMGNVYFEAIWNGTECDKIKEVYDMNNGEIYLHPLGHQLSKRGGDLSEYFTHNPDWLVRYREDCKMERNY